MRASALRGVWSPYETAKPSVFCPQEQLSTSSLPSWGAGGGGDKKTPGGSPFLILLGFFGGCGGDPPQSCFHKQWFGAPPSVAPWGSPFAPDRGHPQTPQHSQVWPQLALPVQGRLEHIPWVLFHSSAATPGSIQLWMLKEGYAALMFHKQGIASGAARACILKPPEPPSWPQAPTAWRSPRHKHTNSSWEAAMWQISDTLVPQGHFGVSQGSWCRREGRTRSAAQLCSCPWLGSCSYSTMPVPGSGLVPAPLQSQKSSPRG